MAHFAELDNNIVTRVIVIHNNELLDENGVEQEANGIAFCQSHFGTNNWLQTSYNAKIRKNYASIGYTYDEQRDAFIPPKPYASWLLDEETCQWVSPVSHPTDNKRYNWDENTISWVLSPNQDPE
jgi:hypothetical protein